MNDTDLESHVHLGTWTNWSRGPIMGRTLTMTRSHGNLLIAFTAFFVAFVASRFWRIICLACHRIYSTSDDRSTLHHQRQVFLRNSTSPESGVLSLLGMVYAWRQAGSKYIFSLVPAVLLAIITTAAFTISGGFSSRIASAIGDTVLLNSNLCGFAGNSKNESMAGDNFANTADKLNSAANYAQQCYSIYGLRMLDCGRFVKDRLYWQATINASCPFAQSMCRTNASNLLLDTGPIDTNKILGLNAPAKERSSVRHILHCAPLVTYGFSGGFSKPGGTFVRYYYGPGIIGDLSNGTEHNYTYEVQSIESQYQFLHNEEDGVFSSTNYGLKYKASRTVNGRPSAYASDFLPLPGLTRSDGDVTIAFLSGNGVVFDQPMEDEWYRGTKAGGLMSIDNAFGTSTFFQPEEAASPLGCVEQYQFCNLARPGRQGCGPLGSLNDAVVGAAQYFNSTAEALTQDEPPSNNREVTRLYWLAKMFVHNPLSIVEVLAFLGPKSLASQASLYSGVQYLLQQGGPQWHSDVTNWFATVMASMQATFVTTVIDPTNNRSGAVLISPTDTFQRELCKRQDQMIRSTKYTSFSLFGLYFTYIFGGLIIFISFALRPALHLLYKHYKYQEYQELEWITTHSLQLHRFAHEELESGQWLRCADDIPVTDRTVTLRALDISDRDHPRLMKLNRPQDEEEKLNDSDEVSGNEVDPALPTEITAEGTSSNDGLILDSTSYNSSVSDEGLGEDVVSAETTSDERAGGNTATLQIPHANSHST